MIGYGGRPARVLVCGAVYGSSYLRALSGAYGGSATVAGVLGRRGPSSVGHARRLGVPYFTSQAEVPDGALDAVCVAVGGGAGIDLARSFLGRGLPVISEHPMRADDVRALQQASAEAGVPWHLNSHFADLPIIQPLVTGCQRLRSSSGPPLFVHATANPRTLFSLLDVLARALGPLGEPRWTALPHVDEARDFLTLSAGPLAGVATTVFCQRTVSAHDDGSATLVSHHVEVGFTQGVMELADTYGPVLWRPNPGSHPGGAPLWNRRPEGAAPTFEHLQQQRDGANYAAVMRLLGPLRGEASPPHQQPGHQLDVATHWDALVEAIGPPILAD